MIGVRITWILLDKKISMKDMVLSVSQASLKELKEILVEDDKTNHSMKFHIEIKPGAEQDLEYYSPYVQRVIVKTILAQLKIDADIQTKRRKQLRPNPIAPWELRIGDYRVFYEIEKKQNVNILAIGHKEHNTLLIRGKEVEL